MPSPRPCLEYLANHTPPRKVERKVERRTVLTSTFAVMVEPRSADDPRSVFSLRRTTLLLKFVAAVQAGLQEISISEIFPYPLFHSLTGRRFLEESNQRDAEHRDSLCINTTAPLVDSGHTLVTLKPAILGKPKVNRRLNAWRSC